MVSQSAPRDTAPRGARRSVEPLFSFHFDASRSSNLVRCVLTFHFFSPHQAERGALVSEKKSITVNSKNHSVFGLQLTHTHYLFFSVGFVCWAQGSELSRRPRTGLLRCNGTQQLRHHYESLSSENPNALPVRSWYLFFPRLDVLFIFGHSDAAIFRGVLVLWWEATVYDEETIWRVFIEDEDSSGESGPLDGLSKMNEGINSKTFSLSRSLLKTGFDLFAVVSGELRGNFYFFDVIFCFLCLAHNKKGCVGFYFLPGVLSSWKAVFVCFCLPFFLSVAWPSTSVSFIKNRILLTALWPLIK